MFIFCKIKNFVDLSRFGLEGQSRFYLDMVRAGAGTALVLGNSDIMRAIATTGFVAQDSTYWTCPVG